MVMEESQLGEYESVDKLSFRPDGEELVILDSGDSNDPITLHYFNLRTKEKRKDVLSAARPGGTIWKYDTEKKGQLLIATIPAFQNSVNIWDALSKKQLASIYIGDFRHIKDISFDNNGNLASIDWGPNTILYTILWDWQNNKSIKIIHSYRDTNEVQFSKISPDGSILAVVDKDNKVEFLELGVFEKLVEKGCSQVRDYLATLDENNGDRNLCN